MNAEPILKIDKFSGMGESGIIYCEGFYPELNNGKSVMGEGFYTSSLLTTATTGYTGLGDVMAILGLATINSYANTYSVYLDNSQKLHAYQVSQSQVKNSLIHTSAGNASSKTDLIETNGGNLLYSKERYIGRGVRFAATGGSTTTIIDTTKNFGTLGFAANDKVTNLKTGIEYTIASIDTTTNTNDTLTFTASGANTTGAGDECIAWEDDRFDTDITRKVWQPLQSNWAKQLKLYGDQYLFTNGNYLGVISSDESTVDETYKQLPVKYQANCFDTNNEKILVGCTYNGMGALLLWNGYSDGWNNIIEFDSPIYAVKNYKLGWIFVSNGIVYMTDGYQIQKMYDINATKKTANTQLSPTNFNNLNIYRDLLLVGNESNDLNLIEKGVYVLDLSNISRGFSLVKIQKGTRTNGTPKCIAVVDRFSTIQSLQIGGDGFITSFVSGGGTAYNDKSFIIQITLPRPIQVSGIGLNIERNIKDYADDSVARTRSLQVSIGDGSRGIISYATSNTNGVATGSLNLNTTTWLNNKTGDQVYLLNDNHFADRAFITNRTDVGSASETWVVSPDFSVSSPTTSNLKLIRTKLLDKITVNAYDLEKEIMFYNTSTGLLSNKLYIEVVSYGGANVLPIDIKEINIYG